MERAGNVAAIIVALAVTGVRAECESGVIVACVLGTFFGCCIAAAAAAVYLFLRRRSRRRRRLGISDRMGKPFKAHANGAFATESSDSIAFTFGQLAAPSETDVGKWSHSKLKVVASDASAPWTFDQSANRHTHTTQALTRISIDCLKVALHKGALIAGQPLLPLYKTSGRHPPCLGKQHLQYNGGRAVALDDACRPLQKCVTIDLLSKDSSGLGISICSSYTNGVFVKELQDRSPAKECRLIDVGDRIVGITISFENIVFDDAAAILGCASPYHVQLHLLKQSQGVQMPAGKLLSGSSQDCGIQLILSPKCKTGGLLGHPAFARSQSLSNGAALNGRLFRESLLCHQTSTTTNGSLDLDEVTSLALDETDSISDVKDAVARTGTASSYASIIALSGTVREDNLISLRQVPTQQESAAVQAGVAAQRWSQHELQISSESKRQSWQDSEASAKPSGLLGTTAAGDETVTTALPEQPVATGDSNATAIALPVITDCEDVQLVLKDGSECVHLNMKDGTVSPKTSTKSHTRSITLDLKCVTTDESETDGGSLTAGELPLTSLEGTGCDGESKNEAVLSTVVEVEKHVLRPRHLPTAVLDLVHKKDAASMVLDQLEAFATLTRSNNNQGPRHDQKIQLNNERSTAGVIQTPEGESSILTAVLNAAKAAGDTSSADEEEQEVESLRHSSTSCEQQTATGGSSWTAAAEIKVLAAKLGSKEGSSSSQSAGNAHSVPAVAQPADQRSAEEERARYFSGMLRAAKS